jgi:hypothetical protein
MCNDIGQAAKIVAVVRTFVAVVALALALAGALAFTVGQGDAATAGESHTITLRGRFLGSGWRPALSRKLNKNKLTSFQLCAVLDHPRGKQFDCIPPAGLGLPAGTELRLEQTPPATGIRRPDSPGWGMVGLSPTAVLRAPLSNDTTGNKVGRVRFRATLRNATTGAIVSRSNVLVLRWR